MRRTSISKLIDLSATRMLHFYENPAPGKRKRGLHKSVKAEPKDSKKLLGMSTLTIVGGYYFYLTFDEVVVRGNNVELITRKHPGAWPLDKCQQYVALLAAMLPPSDTTLVTVRVIVQGGYPRRCINLDGYNLTHVLEYGDDRYEVIGNVHQHSQWAVDKMIAINKGAKAAEAFDALPVPSNFAI